MKKLILAVTCKVRGIVLNQLHESTVVQVALGALHMHRSDRCHSFPFVPAVKTHRGTRHMWLFGFAGLREVNYVTHQ